MKKLIMKLIIIILPSLIFMICVNQLYTNTNGYKSLNSIHKFGNVPTGLNIINLGSSHGMYGLNFEKNDKNGFNFSLEGQSFYYDKLVLETYKRNLNRGCIVVIPVSYFSFGINDEKEISTTPRYYSILDKYSRKKIVDYSLDNLLKYKIFPIMSSGSNIKYVFKDLGIITNSDFDSKKNDYTLNKIDEAALNSAYSNVERININCYDKNVKLLGDILNFCIESGYKPILITTPFTKYYNDHFSEEYKKRFKKDYKDDFYLRVNSLSKKYNVPYIDYSHDERFSNNINLFRDAHHLNLNGRDMFTQIILEDLKHWNYR